MKAEIKKMKVNRPSHEFRSRPSVTVNLCASATDSGAMYEIVRSGCRGLLIASVPLSVSGRYRANDNIAGRAKQVKISIAIRCNHAVFFMNCTLMFFGNVAILTSNIAKSIYAVMTNSPGYPVVNNSHRKKENKQVI